MRPELMRALPRLTMLLLLGGFGLASSVGLSAAQAAPAIQRCADGLRARGYTITSMDIDGGQIFDFEAIRNNQKWDIKTDSNCKVLIEHIDH